MCPPHQLGRRARRPALAKLPATYAARLERLPISDHTRRSYGQVVAGFADWPPFQLKHDYDMIEVRRTGPAATSQIKLRR